MCSKFFYHFLLIVSGILFSYGCRHELLDPGPDPGGGFPSPATSCIPDTSYFNNDIMPVISSNCTMSVCHNPTNPGGNIDLSANHSVKTEAINGKFYGSVAQQGGYSPMPENGAKLSDCEIGQIQKWIIAGSPDN